MTHAMKLLPKGIQSFSKMREDDYIYVDKTEQIHSLITTGNYYFLSRPRRFGKSLLVSTLAELFAGNRALFKNLWIDYSNYDWQSHPVILLSFSTMAHASPQALTDDIVWSLQHIAQQYTIDITDAPSLQTKFKLLIEKLSAINRVVILVDEYDYAILSNIHNLSLAEACRDVLRDFFGVIKDLDKHIRFVFITGVSKFSKTSIFSGLNNLEDLTISATGATLLGYTPQELNSYFNAYIIKLAQSHQISPEMLIDKMRSWYNGYLFDIDTNNQVYNPYSVLLFLNSGRFLNYWFESGTPSFLLNLIKTQEFSIVTLDSLEATSNELGTIEIDDIAITPLLFQAGYLTIKYYDADSTNYHMTFPNYEVRESFLKYLLRKFTKITLATINNFAIKLIGALKENNIDLFCRLLQTFFADIPASMHIPLERYYQTIIFVLAKILGLNSHVEVSTNVGRIDMVIELAHDIYIFEFKIRADAHKALEQIEQKQYYQKYLASNKRIMLIGINFDIKKRNIEDWVVKGVEEKY